ncbi:MAG: enoyl-CoA hydratase [bacterium]|nr:enoyl-CoA hydratase [bacterium]MCP5042294.1 enoyl-CoA hydratase [bacterium]
MREYCFAERDGRILTVTINRPDVMNAVHPMANAELGEVFDEFVADKGLWVAIITGAGDRAFSAGNDLKFQASGGMKDGKAAMPEHGFGGLTTRYDNDKPVIAAVNGVAMGGGFEIALACDLIVASEKAVFSLPEPRVGLAAMGGGIHRLPRQIGLKHAMGMLLTGRRVSAQEGYDLGFVNEVVAHEDVMPAARRWAEQIVECAPLSVRASKQSAMQGLDKANLQEATESHYETVRSMLKSKDYVEGPLAFTQKRKPNWVGE